MRRYLVLLFVFGLATHLAAQRSGPSSPPKGGLQIRNISAYTVYYSKTLPNSGYVPGFTELQSDVGGGGSAEIGWSNFGERSGISVVYTPSYTGRIRYAAWNALNHALFLYVRRRFTPRWSFHSSVNGDLGTQEGFLFAPTVFSSVASAPASFDDLAAALLTSKFNNPQLASAFSSAPAESPVRNLVYGARVLTAGGQASFTYRYSPRLSFTFGGNASRSQHISEMRSVQSSYLLLDTTSGTAKAEVSYALSPLTQLSGSVNTSRISSSLYETQTTTSSVALGRTMAKRWLLRIYGGAAVSNVLRLPANSSLTAKPRPAFGGSLALKTFSQTFLGSFDHVANDSYGVGASSNSASSASWRWKRPDSVWWLESAVSWEQLQGVGQDITGWRASAGLGRSLSAHVALLTQYAYLKYSGRFQRVANNLSQSAVRVSLVWTPRPDVPR